MIFLHKLELLFTDISKCCVTWSFLRGCCDSLYIWCMVVLSIDIYIDTRRPALRDTLSTVSCARIIVLLLVIISTPIYLNISLLHGVVYLHAPKLQPFCSTLPTFTKAAIKLQHAGVIINSFAAMTTTAALCSLTFCSGSKKYK